MMPMGLAIMIRLHNFVRSGDDAGEDSILNRRVIKKLPFLVRGDTHHIMR